MEDGNNSSMETKMKESLEEVKRILIKWNYPETMVTRIANGIVMEGDILISGPESDSEDENISRINDISENMLNLRGESRGLCNYTSSTPSWPHCHFCGCIYLTPSDCLSHEDDCTSAL